MTSERSLTVASPLELRAARSKPNFPFGNSPRSVLRGANFLTTDLTLEKSVAVTEKVRFDIRGEFYNLLNHANFNVPGSTLGAADFGTVTSARAGRTIQLAGRLSF